MPHRSDTWTDALFIYPLYHVNFLTSFMEWFRFFFFNGVTVKTENWKIKVVNFVFKQLTPYYNMPSANINRRIFCDIMVYNLPH